MGVNFLILALALAYITDTSEGMVPRKSVNSGKDYIFIRGKHFPRNVSMIASPVLGGTAAQLFTQCMDWTQKDPCNQTWSQRYWVKSSFYKTGGPIFYMLGEESAFDGQIDGGEWYNYAAQYNATLVAIEHRFYGQSIPTTERSLKALGLLTSQQALADYAYFMPWFKTQQKLPNDTKVVAFGGSYGGNLAAWFRLKYPNVVNVAVSSSGPLEAQFDFTGYLKTISQVIKDNNQDCATQIYNAMNCIQLLIENQTCINTTVTLDQIQPSLYECYDYDLTDPTSIQYFFRNLIMNAWANNYPWSDDESRCSALNQDAGLTGDVIKDYGSYLKTSGESDICPPTTPTSTPTPTTTGPSGSSNSERSLTSSKRGVGHHDEILDFINSDVGQTVGAAGWTWQTCNEFGYFQTADPVYRLFGTELNADSYVSLCQSQFGKQFTAKYIQSKIAKTNQYYHGKQNKGTCIIFVNGSWDPWHTLGITNATETSKKNSVVFIPKGEHCEDMNGNIDKPDTIAGQATIQTLIGTYLQNPKC